ncbi:MAG: glycosyltransferase [Candidatus Margulisiibacteriota bacterium]
MRIAFFADSYKPYLSGVTNSIDILAKELRNLGHRVYIFCPAYPKQIENDPDVFRFPSFAGGYPKFRLAIPLIQKIPEVDVIHLHSPFQAGLLGRFVARHRNLPLAYTFHTLFTRYVHYLPFLPESLAKMGIVNYLKFFSKKVDQIIVPSQLAKRVLRSWKISVPIEVVPSGVEINSPYLKDLSFHREILREKYQIPKDIKVLMYIGRLSKEKNITFLIEAYKKLRERELELYLVLVGGGPLAKEIKHQKLKNLILIEEVPYPKILKYYSLGDIFIFSSLTETQGLVLAEAKAAGLPVVALYAAGLADTVRSGIDGYLVPRNLDSFLEHIYRLLTNPDLYRQMAQAARNDARQRLSSALVAKQIENVYNSLIIKRGESK